MLNYTVNHWGSDPDAGNDDCWQGFDFATLDEAMAKFHEGARHDVAFVEIDGPGIYAKRANPCFRPSRDCDDEWRREIAREEGMLHGCEAYNEAMGWD